MSLLIRPGVFARSASLAYPFACSSHYVPPATGRAFSVSPHAAIEAGKSRLASTALKAAVRDSEENSEGETKVVGAEIKGAEGPHYQGEWRIPALLLKQKLMENRSSPVSGESAHRHVEDGRLDTHEPDLHRGCKHSLLQGYSRVSCGKMRRASTVGN